MLLKDSAKLKKFWRPERWAGILWSIRSLRSQNKVMHIKNFAKTSKVNSIIFIRWKKQSIKKHKLKHWHTWWMKNSQLQISRRPIWFISLKRHPLKSFSRVFTSCKVKRKWLNFTENWLNWFILTKIATNWLTRCSKKSHRLIKVSWPKLKKEILEELMKNSKVSNISTWNTLTLHIRHTLMPSTQMGLFTDNLSYLHLSHSQLSATTHENVIQGNF